MSGFGDVLVCGKYMLVCSEGVVFVVVFDLRLFIGDEDDFFGMGVI